MKTKITYLSIIFLMVFGLFSGYAQEEQLKLTPKQKELLQAQKDQLKENRALFKASLTKPQWNILRNNRLSPREKREAILASLTKRQKLILAKNKEALQRRTDDFRATLTERQKQRLRHLLRVRGGVIDQEIMKNDFRNKRN
ncbi:hypothetical protein MWU59_11870 [Flavobacteriaceae bacterium F08102]|nr:hypothetical protein [Flavobacteriaceae bacterium F08102]